MKILIVYGSTHGHTARIAERIGARLRERGNEVHVTDRLWRVRAARFDAVLIGGRVHGDRYPWRVTHFIRRNLRALQSRPSAFFSVSLLQLSRNPVQRAKTETLPQWRAAQLGWTPDRIEVIAGGLNFKAQYGRLAPLAIRMWRRPLRAQLDASLPEQVFTDWARVDQFADSFLETAQRRSRGAERPMQSHDA